jgi:phosphodiesterase/alkaline phosphatase D-like protein
MRSAWAADASCAGYLSNYLSYYRLYSQRPALQNMVVGGAHDG